jgi:cell division protease FtsH
MQKIKKSVKPAEKKDGAKKAPQTRSQKILRGPLFWIIVAIIAVTVFGQITNAANRYTEIKTSQALAAISQSQVESAVLVDKSQKIRLILSGGNTIKVQQKLKPSMLLAKSQRWLMRSPLIHLQRAGALMFQNNRS